MGLDNPLHIAFLLIVLLLVFGARRLPEMGRSIGTGMREFKDSISGQSAHQPLAVPEQQPPAAVDANAPNQTSAAAAFGEQQRS
jgi:sec-independent protein translocase protein TatA